MDVTNAENTVEVDLWYSTSLDLGLNLASELAAMSLSYTADFNSKALFTPRIATYPCHDCAEDFKKQNCVSKVPTVAICQTSTRSMALQPKMYQ